MEMDYCRKKCHLKEDMRSSKAEGQGYNAMPTSDKIAYESRMEMVRCSDPNYTISQTRAT